MKKINKKVKRIGIYLTFVLLLFWGIATTLNLGQLKKDYKSLEQNIYSCETKNKTIQTSYENTLKENADKETEIENLNAQINDLNNTINDLNSQITSLKKK